MKDEKRGRTGLINDVQDILDEKFAPQIKKLKLIEEVYVRSGFDGIGGSSVASIIDGLYYIASDAIEAFDQVNADIAALKDPSNGLTIAV